MRTRSKTRKQRTLLRVSNACLLRMRKNETPTRDTQTLITLHLIRLARLSYFHAARRGTITPRERIAVQDLDRLKPTWKKWTSFFISSDHIKAARIARSMIRSASDY